MDDYNFDNTTFVKYTNIVYDIDSVINKIKSCNDPDEIKQIILYQHDIIFTRDNLVNNNIEKIQELFTDIEFLNILDDISGLLLPKLVESEFIFLNKMIYDFFIYSSRFYIDTKIKNVQTKMNSIAMNINKDIIIGLSSIMGINAALKLSIISRSSFKFDNIVHRVNMFIYDSSLDSWDIAKIYRIIYGDYKIGCELVYAIGERKFSSLFTYTMLEYPKYNADQKFLLQFNKVSKLILDMLNDLRPIQLESVLLNYANIINLYNTPEDKLRFSLKEYGNEQLVFFIKSIEELHNIYIY